MRDKHHKLRNVSLRDSVTRHQYTYEMLKWDNDIDQPIKRLVLAVSCRDNLACVKDNFPTSDSPHPS